MTDRTDVTDQVYDIVIVGGGAAGLNAALVLARARRRVLVVDAGEPRNARAEHMHGFLSRDGAQPWLLNRIGREEVRGYGAEFTRESVTSVRPGYYLRLADGREVRARRVLIATGLSDELPDIEGLAEHWGRGAQACPYCHGWEVRDQLLGVIGTSERSMHQTLLLRQWSADLVLFQHTMPEPSAEERAKLAARGIALVPGEVRRLTADADRLRGVELADGTVWPRSAVFVGPRFVPNNTLLSGLGCGIADSGFVETDATGRTSEPGVWAAGNVTDPAALVIGAAAGGARVATVINMDLVEEETADALAG